MFLLYGAITTILTEILKWLTSRLGSEKLASAIILLFAFLITLFISLVVNFSKDIMSVETLKVWGASFATAIAWYEVLIKRLSFDKISGIFKK